MSTVFRRHCELAKQSRMLVFSGCLICLALFMSGCQPSVSIYNDDSSRQETYAATKLEKTLKENGYKISQGNGKYRINIAIDSLQLEKEAFTISSEGREISITGGSGRGVIYGAFSLAEDIRNGIPLSDCRPKNEKPGLTFRALKHNLPWDGYRHSEALHLHYETCRDTSYWEAFLDMMAENRFNTLTMWNLHPYPFMIMPKNFPEASPFTADEFKEWQQLYRTIFRMAKDRDIETYIFCYNIFTTPGLAKAHNLPIVNEERHFFMQSDTSEIVKRYIRECVTQVLDEYPDLTGFGPTLAEGMGGMTPEEREAWSLEVLIEGMRQANRKTKYVHRAPASANTSSGGSTSIEAERLTRAVIEKEAEMGFTDGPVWVEFKFNWSHGHSTPKLVKVHGGKLTDTYFNPLSDKYKVVWHLRNDDFFCLRWGVPSFARSHVKLNSQPYVGGYFLGSETYIPAKDYFTKDTLNLPWKYAFERQWLFYKIWGRLLYNPETPDEVFQAEFIRRYGEKGKNLLEASSLAGATPLRFASAFDYTWDFTLYSEGMMALVYRNEDNPRTGVFYVSVDRLINQPPLDPDYVSVAEYVRAISEGKSFGQERTTPPDLADMLERDCSRALALVEDITVGKDKALLYEVADIRTWSYLGLHFAEKIRGAVALQTYRVQGGEENKQKAIAHLEKGLQYWDNVIAITRPLYNDMPLVHYSEMDGKNGTQWRENDHLRFHWELIRPDVAKDIEIANK